MPARPALGFATLSGLGAFSGFSGLSDASVAAGFAPFITSLAVRESTGSRCASTRIRSENPSTVREAVLSSWCRSALGIR